MSDRLIPADAQRAAVRAGIRTAAQSLSAAIPTASIVLALTGDWWLSAGLAAAGAVATAAMAGLASYLSILASGIPADYAPEITSSGTPRRALEEPA